MVGRRKYARIFDPYGDGCTAISYEWGKPALERTHSLMKERGILAFPIVGQHETPSSAMYIQKPRISAAKCTGSALRPRSKHKMQYISHL